MRIKTETKMILKTKKTLSETRLFSVISAAWADTTNRCNGSTDHAKFSRCSLSRSVKIPLEIPVSAS